MRVPWYLMAKGKGGGGYKTASGPIVSVNDALAAPLRSLVANIEPVQEGTGDPSPDNVRPISGWSAVNVWRTGKNLFDKTYTFTAGKLIGADGSITDNSNYSYCNEYIRVKPSTAYTFSGNIIVPSAYNGVAFYDSDRNFISRFTPPLGVNASFTTPNNCAYLRFNAITAVLDVNTIQIEEGSTVSPYETYSGNQYTIQLGNTYYGGTLDVTNGVLTVDRAEVDLGTLSWAYNASAERFSARTDQMNAGLYTIANSICSEYSYYPNVYMDNDRTYFVFCTYNNSVFIRDSAYSDAATFKTAMSGVQLVYPLATPITIPLTPTEISTLQGQNNVWADSGDVTIEYLSAGGANADLMKLAVAFMGRK